MIKIENRPDEGDDREDDNNASYYLINNKDAVGVKLASDFVNKPSQAKPPQQGTEHNAKIPYPHLQGHVGHHESKLREGCHEEEYDEWIRQRHEESRQGIVEKRSLLATALVHVLHRITFEAIDAEDQQHESAKNLQIELILRIVDEIHHKAHTQSREKSIYDVAACRSDTGHETIPTPLVQSALDTQNAYRSHGG